MNTECRGQDEPNTDMEKSFPGHGERRTKDEREE